MPLSKEQREAIEAIAKDPKVAPEDFENAVRTARGSAALDKMANEVSGFMTVTVTDWTALVDFIKRKDIGGQHPQQLYEPMLAALRRAVQSNDAEQLGLVLLLLAMAVKHD